MEKLKPCPFCNGEATTEVDYDSVGMGDLVLSAYVKCTECHVGKRCSKNMSHATFEDYLNLFNVAIEAWNTRYS